nr:MAG TPA: hypothetical protein [Caudoviricetes sp.]
MLYNTIIPYYTFYLNTIIAINTIIDLFKIVVHCNHSHGNYHNTMLSNSTFHYPFFCIYGIIGL